MHHGTCMFQTYMFQSYTHILTNTHTFPHLVIHHDKDRCPHCHILGTLIYQPLGYIPIILTLPLHCCLGVILHVCVCWVCVCWVCVCWVCVCDCVCVWGGGCVSVSFFSVYMCECNSFLCVYTPPNITSPLHPHQQEKTSTTWITPTFNTHNTHPQHPQHTHTQHPKPPTH